MKNLLQKAPLTAPLDIANPNNLRIFSQEQMLQAKFDDDLRHVQREAEQKLEGILEETKSQVELLKLENDAWKEKLLKESWRKLQDVEKRFQHKMENVESGYRHQLDEAEREAQKREDVFLSSMKRKSADGRRESNSEIGKSSSEVNFIFKRSPPHPRHLRAIKCHI